MKTKVITLKGEKIRELPELLREKLSGTSFFWKAIEGDCATEIIDTGYTVVLFYEKYFSRISSNLLLSAVFDFSVEGICMVNIVAGGGKSGTFSFGWWTEWEIINICLRAIAGICVEIDCDCEDVT